MNKLIKDQLNNVTSTKIEYDENTTHIFIPKTIKVLNTSMKVGCIYDIELFDSIVNPPPSSTLASNWNNGVVPEYKLYTVEVISNTAKMIKVNGVAMENNASQFYGYLPSDGFEIIRRYE